MELSTSISRIKYITWGVEMDIDRDWFKDELKHQSKTSQQLAKYLGLDPSAVARLWSGDRRLLPDEAIKMSEFLGHPLDVILDKAGLPVGSIMPNKFIKTTGVINRSCVVRPLSRKRDAVPVPLPPGISLTAQALMFDTTGTALEYADRWVFYYVAEIGFSPEALNRLCILDIKDGPTMLAVVKKGDRRGLYRVFDFSGKEEKEQKQIVNASPILWIRS